MDHQPLMFTYRQLVVSCASALLACVSFWTAFRLVFGEVPAVSILNMSVLYNLRLEMPISVSRWWDAALAVPWLAVIWGVNRLNSGHWAVTASVVSSLIIGIATAFGCCGLLEGAAACLVAAWLTALVVFRTEEITIGSLPDCVAFYGVVATFLSPLAATAAGLMIGLSQGLAVGLAFAGVIVSVSGLLTGLIAVVMEIGGSAMGERQRVVPEDEDSVLETVAGAVVICLLILCMAVKMFVGQDEEDQDGQSD